MERTWIVATAAIAAMLLAGCQSSRTAPVPESQGAEVSAELYQPTDHALLVIEGGAGTAQSAEPLMTQWSREGTGETLALRLAPGKPQVRLLKPGRYRLDSATGELADLYPKDEASPHLGELLLDPGDVVYAGKLLMREEPAPRAKLVIEVKSDLALASAAVEAAHPEQAPLLKTRLLAVVK